MTPEIFTLKTTVKSTLSDFFTPVAIYLRLRDHFRDTVLLESAGNQNAENNMSFIAVNAIAGIEVTDNKNCEIKLPGRPPRKEFLADRKLTEVLQQFSQQFRCEEATSPLAKYAQGLFGYIAYDALPLLEKINFKETAAETALPLVRFRLYQYVIAINHHTDTLHIIENKIVGLRSEILTVENLIYQKNTPIFPFEKVGEETSNLTDDEYCEAVDQAKKHCFRGDVFQLVLSRRFCQAFRGDEFNVYRALRHINPSPYLFYFDYGSYKLFGSSPESQMIIKDHKSVIHPIAGTFKRTGNLEEDLQAAERLKADAKENAEHTMLVDLARNDLSIHGKNTTVSRLKEIQFFSHVIHMVSEVTADLPENYNPFEVFASTFPQGTLSGAPKYKALQLIDRYEKTSRGFYGGGIGFMGFDGSCNMAIMIRTFLSKENKLYSQAGAGIVAASTAEGELQEVNHKLNALKLAVKKAEQIN